MERPFYINKIKELSAGFPVVCLLGPRQTGKTTLAKAYAKEVGHHYSRVHIFDLENAADLAALEQAQMVLTPLEGLIIIDEIQRRPDLFPTLRVLVDAKPRHQHWLILGSASRDLLQQSSETLAGRIAYLEICPFSFLETHDIPSLWCRGGFPNAWLASSDSMSMEWRKNYIRTFLEQDIPGFGLHVAPAALRRFWMMLAHWHGNILNFEELSRSLGSTTKSIRHYLDILSDTFMIRQLQPWWENIGKRQVKSPKVYFRDSGLLHYLLNIPTQAELYRHPKVGASWEGFVIEELIRCLEMDADQSFFWATHQQAEIDLLAFQGGKRLGFEVKFSDAPRLSRSMMIALEDLKLDELIVIYPGERSYALHEKIRVINLAEYLSRA